MKASQVFDNERVDKNFFALVYLLKDPYQVLLVIIILIGCNGFLEGVGNECFDLFMFF
jgi:hypothetical protein